MDKWVLESETPNISILRKPPYIIWFFNMLTSFWLFLFIIKLYSCNDIFKQSVLFYAKSYPTFCI